MIFKEYNVRVASRYFKGPELLVDYQMYDYRFVLSIISLKILKEAPIYEHCSSYQPGHVEPRLYAGLHDLQKGALLPWP